MNRLFTNKIKYRKIDLQIIFVFVVGDQRNPLILFDFVQGALGTTRKSYLLVVPVAAPHATLSISCCFAGSCVRPTVQYVISACISASYCVCYGERCEEIFEILFYLHNNVKRLPTVLRYSIARLVLDQERDNFEKRKREREKERKRESKL